MKYLIVWHPCDDEFRDDEECKRFETWVEVKAYIAWLLSVSPNVFYYAGPIWKTNAVIE